MSDHKIEQTRLPKTIQAAQQDAKRLAADFSFALQRPYKGPLAIAGGYVRDLATGRLPKDLDVFLDAGFIPTLVEATELGNRLADLLGDGARVEEVFASYGTWAADVEGVVRIELPQPSWYQNCYIPHGVDIVVLRRDKLEQYGYVVGDEPSYLEAIIARVDLRLNAIGATESVMRKNVWFEDDVLKERLVVQKARLDPTAGEDLKRISRRLRRLAEEKFKGFSVAYELPNGDLSDLSPFGNDGFVQLT